MIFAAAEKERTARRMTDKDIIKALKCCVIDDCDVCPYKRNCKNVMCDVLELINRQQAEIEAWKNEYLRACAERDVRIVTTKFTRAEAVKEFAMKLKCGVPQETGIIRCADIDNLVKEMVGDEE